MADPPDDFTESSDGLLRHGPTGVCFRHVPGGQVRLGFSEAEAATLRAALLEGCDDDAAMGLEFLDAADVNPVTQRTLAPFLLAVDPLTDAQLTALLGEAAQVELEGCLSMTGAAAVVEQLRARGLRLPTADEWEHAYRAGTTTPFPWGSDRPTSPWAPENAFGFSGMGEFAELCQGDVARGGAGAYWPWQGVAEWVTLLSASRSAAAEHDGFLRIRPALGL